MSDVTKIEWTDHTFNPWWGCSRISPACRFCYADRDARRYGHDLWRRNGQRRMLTDRNWARPLKWNRDAERAGTPEKVFCASMADVFEDHPDLEEPRKRLWDLIESTPSLRWQLLTKRPGNVAGMVPWGSDWPAWVWLGVSAENQRWAETRIPVLMSLPARTKFISAEPLLGPIDLQAAHAGGHRGDRPCPPMADWLITGGESGGRARPMELDWVRGLLAQCLEPGATPRPFVKQLGTVLGRELGAGPKGGDMGRWPADLRVREFPAAVTEEGDRS
ncbi:MAG: phage Gp37/Gp68 family protein [Streptosporangiales bacterium]|nr:phage Gp37/Gp68 family protein [Streptosporangiales bacterium]